MAGKITIVRNLTRPLDLYNFSCTKSADLQKLSFFGDIFFARCGNLHETISEEMYNDCEPQRCSAVMER